MILTISNQKIITLAWGPRRATSNKRYGDVKSLYPRKITASHRLWFSWIISGSIKWINGDVYVVLPVAQAKDKHRTKIKVKEVIQEHNNEHIDIDELIRQRETLRSQKRFDEADAIRDKINAAGAMVSDKKI